MFFEQIIYKCCARDVNTTSIFERHLSLNDSFLYISGFQITFSEINLWRSCIHCYINELNFNYTTGEEIWFVVLAVYIKSKDLYCYQVNNIWIVDFSYTQQPKKEKKNLTSFNPRIYKIKFCSRKKPINFLHWTVRMKIKYFQITFAICVTKLYSTCEIRLV